MTALVSRSPLGTLRMSETQRTTTTATRRRTARYAFDEEDGPPMKRARREEEGEDKVEVNGGAKVVEKGGQQQQGGKQQQGKTRGNAKGKRSKAGEFVGFPLGGCSACCACGRGGNGRVWCGIFG